MDFRLSPESVPSGGAPECVFENIRGPELFCPDCGVAFQRADLLRRHVAAAHTLVHIVLILTYLVYNILLANYQFICTHTWCCAVKRFEQI